MHIFFEQPVSRCRRGDHPLPPRAQGGNRLIEEEVAQASDPFLVKR
jgi:hypothetical protein